MNVLFLSCEHGGNEVPEALLPYFAGHREVLNTHRGLDIGALDLFQRLRPLAMESTYTTLSRLCIEMNRTEGHPRHFSAFTKGITAGQRQHLLERYHRYRDGFTARIRAAIAQGHHVTHIAVHSFTPVLDGQERNLDIGLLYDPSRISERTFCRTWREAIKDEDAKLVVRMNQPYKGISDGFPTALRKAFKHHYSGIELEVNQRFAHNGIMAEHVKDVLFTSVRHLFPPSA